MKQNKKGITLIALVVTIVVLVILAAVSINVLLGDNGIIQKAKEAGQETRLATIKEEVIIAWGAVQAQSNTSQDEWFDEAAALQEELRKQDPEATVDWNDVGLDVFYKDMNFLLDYEGNLQNKIDWKAISWKDMQGEVEYGSMFGLDQNGKVYSIQIEENGKGNCFCISDMNSTVLYQRKIKEIAFNKRTVMVLDFDGKVYTWGSNNTGQIGNGTNGEPVLEPICISDLEGNALKGEKIVSIGCDESEATRTRGSDEKSILFAIAEDGKVYSWGYNAEGQLGDNTGISKNMPVCISDIEGNILQGKQICQVVARYETAILLDTQGKVYQMKEGSSCETENSARSFYKKKVNKIKSLISYKHFVLFGEEGSYIEYFT